MISSTWGALRLEDYLYNQHRESKTVLLERCRNVADGAAGEQAGLRLEKMLEIFRARLEIFSFGTRYAR